ncbi:MAG: hypothetical protein RL033_4501, partial [Pseudomonadota bacterium]
MTSRFSFVATSTVLASLLVFASACSETLYQDIGTGNGGEGGDDGAGGDGAGAGGPTGQGDCPSNRKEQNICQPDVPALAVAEDCDFGVQDGACKPAAIEPGTLADCAAGITDGLCDPAPPTFTNWTCPAGSSPLPGLHTAAGGTLAVEGVNGFTACRASWSDACDDDAMPHFGSNACTAVSARACPADWPADDVIRAAAGSGGAAPIVFVSPAGTGDGLTRLTPTGLVAALAAANDGDVIALAAGNYIAAINVTVGARIVGACAAGTTLSPGDTNEAAPTVLLSGQNARIFDVSISGNRPGIGVTAGGAGISNVQILGALVSGVNVSAGGNVAMTNVLISGTRRNAAQAAGNGLSVVAGSGADLAGVALLNSAGAAVNVSGASSTVTGLDVIVTDSEAQGAVVSSGGNLELTRAVFARNNDSGVTIQGANSTAILNDAYVTGTVAATAGSLSGTAVNISGGGELVAQRFLATGNPLGVRVNGGESAITLTDAIIADPSALGTNPAGNAGVGILAEAGPDITATRLALLRTRGGLIQQAGIARLENVVVAGSTGAGLSFAGGDVGVVQTTLADNANGVSLTTNADFELTDLRVVDTRKVGAATSRALYIDGSSGNAQQLVLARNAEYGVYVSGARVDVNLTDLRITDTRSITENGKAVRGIGLVVAAPEGAPAVGVTRGLIAHSHEYGVFVSGPGPQVFLTDTSVVDTQAVDAPARAGGILFVNAAAAAPSAGALLNLERTIVRDNADSAVAISCGGIEAIFADVSILNTLALANGSATGGLTVQGGVDLDGTRVLVAGNVRAGISVDGVSTKAVFGDLVINDTTAVAGSATSGEGLKVVGAAVSVDRGSLLRNTASGVWAAQNANLVLNDVAIDETQAPNTGSGVGIDLVGARLKAARLTVSKSHGLALSVALGSAVTVNDLNITGTEASAIGGRGVEVSSGSQVELNRVAVAGSKDYAVLVAGPDGGTPALLSQFPRLDGTALPTETKLGLFDLSVHEAGGGGLAVLPGANLELDTFDIRTSSVVGMQLLEGAT